MYVCTEDTVVAACARKDRYGQGNEPLEEKGLWRVRGCLAYDFVVNVFGFSIFSAKLSVRHKRRAVVTFIEAVMMQSSGACMDQPKKQNSANPMSAKRGGGRGEGLPQMNACTFEYHVPCRNKEEPPRHVLDTNNSPRPHKVEDESTVVLQLHIAASQKKNTKKSGVSVFRSLINPPERLVFTANGFAAI